MLSKPLSRLPSGAANEPELDIQIAPAPSHEAHADGSVTIDLSGASSEPDESPLDSEHNENLAERLEEDDLNKLSGELMDDVEADLRSRGDWEKTYKDGLRLLGLNIEKRSEPWEGACGIVHPILAEAVVRFQAELISETFPPHGPVKTKIWGAPSKEKEEAAARVRDDMNIEITDRMTEYRNEHERLLWNLPIAGSALKKVYYDPNLGRQVSMFVAAEDFIVAYGASDLASCQRYTQVMKKTDNELKKLVAVKFYREVPLSEPSTTPNIVKEQKDKIAGQVELGQTSYHTLYEINVDLDLPKFKDKDGIALPYVVTIDKDTRKILAIRRNYEEDDTQKKKRQYFVHYTYIPGFGFYGFGLIHLVGGFAEGATSILRQLVDAGTLSNLPGGLKTRGLRIKGDDTPIAPGEFRDVDVPGGTLKENLMPLPYKEPSAVLAQLLEMIVEEGRKFAAVAEMKVADFDSNSPVGTTMALLERTLKVMAAVQSRIYEAMKLEFRLIKDIISDYGAKVYQYDPESGDRSTRRADYELVDVLPVADPNAATMSQRIVQWQAVMQLAQMAPQIYDLPELHAEMLQILGVKKIDKLLPSWKDNMVPTDPVSENMAILNMKPVKAFISQDHMSHIQVHQAAMQDPKIQMIVGQNPLAQQIQAAGMAHLLEHVAYQYRSEMEAMLGAPLPSPDATLPPELEAQMSPLLAQASQKLLGKSQNEAAQMAAQQASQDPVVAAQMEEVKIKRDEVERKKAKDAADNQLNQQKLELDRQKAAMDSQGQGLKIGTDMAKERMKMQQADNHKQFDAVAAAGHKMQDHAHAHDIEHLQHHHAQQLEQLKQAHEQQLAQMQQQHAHVLEAQKFQNTQSTNAQGAMHQMAQNEQTAQHAEQAADQQAQHQKSLEVTKAAVAPKPQPAAKTKSKGKK